MTSDRIEIHKLEIFARHGVYKQENDLGQKFYISVQLSVNTGRAATDDDIHQSVNYAQVCENLTGWMQEKSYKLIETAAEHCARMLLNTYPEVEGVVLDLEKPAAPMPYHTDTVLVHIERRRHQVFLSFGSNIGDREATIGKALGMIRDHEDMKLVCVSSLIETKAYGKEDQPDFLNGALLLETWLGPEDLLDELHKIEAALGRERKVHWGPRTIDLDIIFYDHEIIDTPDLHIPHIDMANRLFVLRPLMQIGGWYRHPVLNMTVEQLLGQLQEK